MKRIKPGVPFREARLISSSSFQSYCQENGVSLLPDELEKFHKYGLLYPAVKVYRGYSELKKILSHFSILRQRIV